MNQHLYTIGYITHTTDAVRAAQAMMSKWFNRPLGMIRFRQEENP